MNGPGLKSSQHWKSDSLTRMCCTNSTPLPGNSMKNGLPPLVGCATAMLESYIQGAATQLVQRASALKVLIPRPPKPEFQVLATRCSQEIDAAVKELKFIRDNLVQKKPELASTRLRQFRRVSSWIDRIENEAIAAIARADTGESKIHALLFKMTSEINYPIEPPTISLLSQQYFYVN